MLAVVGEQTIRKKDLLDEGKHLRERGRPVAGKQELLEEMIGSRRLLEYARLQGIDQDPEFTRAVDSLLIGTLKKRELMPAIEAVKVGDEDLRQEYESRKDSLATPAALRFSMIAVNLPMKVTEARRAEGKARIEAARELARTGAAGFSEAAVKYSDHQASRYRGGDVGWNTAGQPHARIPEPALAAGHELASDGELSDIIEAPSAYYLIKRTATREAAVPSFEEVSSRLQVEVLKAKRLAVQEAFDAKVAAAVGVERFPDHLKAVVFEGQPQPDEDRPPANP